MDSYEVDLVYPKDEIILCKEYDLIVIPLEGYVTMKLYNEGHWLVYECIGFKPFLEKYDSRSRLSSRLL